MWKWLHPYAKAENAYRLAGRMLPWFAVPGTLLLLIGTVWGLGFTPTDCKQGDGFRIIYIHVPAAFISMGAYASMAIAALVGMVWQIRQADYAVAAFAPVGAAFTVIALATGAIWGKPMWGAWWIWDARLTSELILLFLYLGVIALYNAFPDRTLAGRAAGILALVGVVNLPIIHYSVEWWNTLHQGATISKFERPSMDTRMLWPLLINILAISLVMGAMGLANFRNEILRRESNRPWVAAVLKIGNSKEESL